MDRDYAMALQKKMMMMTLILMTMTRLTRRALLVVTPLAE